MMHKKNQSTNGSSSKYFSRYGSDFQMRLVVSLLNDKIFFERIIDIVKPEYFADSEVYRWIVEKVLYIYNTKKIIPAYNDLEILASDESNNQIFFEQLQKELENIKNLQINIDLIMVKEKAIEFCKNQEMKNAILKSVDYLKQEKWDNIRKVIDHALKAGEERILGHNYFDDYEFRFNNYREGIISTGWECVDKLIQGGSAEGELFCIIASAGIGKSTCLTNIGYAALAQGKNVIHYTLELSATMIGLKYDARISDIEIDEIRNNQQIVADKLREFKTNGAGTLLIKQYPTKTPTILNIRTHLQQIINQGITPNLIIIDYADLIKPESKQKEKRHELSDLYEDLRSLAGELKCTVWTASQANRQNSEEEIITLQGFAESFAKAHVSDVVISLSRDLKKSMLNNNAAGTVFIAKNRVGPVGRIFTAELDMAKAYVNIREYDTASDGKSVKQKLDLILTELDRSKLKSGLDDKDMNSMAQHYNKFKKNGSEVRR